MNGSREGAIGRPDRGIGSRRHPAINIGLGLSLLGGALFGAGVCVSGMVRPSKVLGFLDFGGAFDASLLFVMASALAVTIAAWRIVARLRTPRFGTAFPPPPATTIDVRLVGGAAIFGFGWGLSGYCPGPAIVSLVSGAPAVFVFCAAMAAGMLVVELRDRSSRDD